MRVFKIMSKNARAFKMTVGISLQHFDSLMRGLEKAHPQAESERPDRPDRKRQAGADRRLSPHYPEQGLPVFMYCRTYLIQDVMTRLFWISQESISASISKISAIIRDRLPIPQRIHKRVCKATTMNDLI